MRPSWIAVVLSAVCVQAIGSLPEGHVSGRISSVKGSTVSVFHDRITFEVSPDAYFSKPFSDVEHLSVGMLVAAVIRVDGQKLVAEQILGDDGLKSAYDAQIVGPPQSKSASSVTVLGMVVDIPPGTPILDEGHDQKFETIPDGYRVKINLTEKDGRVVATRVAVSRLVRTLRADLRYFGKILSIDGDRWKMKTDESETITLTVDKETMLPGKVAAGDRVIVLAEDTGSRLMAAFIQAEGPAKVVPEPPAPKSRVTDTAKFFSESQRAQLAAAVKKSGGNTYVYITESVPGGTGANELVKRWKLPKRGLVVIFVLVEDHVVAFASDLPETVTDQVRDTVIYPAFQKGDFLGGLIAAVDAFGKRSR